MLDTMRDLAALHADRHINGAQGYLPARHQPQPSSTYNLPRLSLVSLRPNGIQDPSDLGSGI